MATPYRCWAEIDLDAVRENLVWIRHAVGPGVKIISVVKADAYGHGLKPMAASLMQSGTDIFGVANLTEASAIRSVGKGWPILMLGACLPGEIDTAVKDDVMPTISSMEEAVGFSRTAAKMHKTVCAHLKVDTGMGRLGVRSSEALALFKAIRHLPAFKVVGVYTHYAAVEDNAAFSRQQRTDFQAVVRSLKDHGCRPELLHINNSGGILWEPTTVGNAVRPGLLVYGVTPQGTRRVPSKWKNTLQPALSWKCRVSLVKTIRKGESLSYGRTFRAARSMKVATLTAGYGDGYPRAGSNRAQVLIGGRLCPIVGRVTMDQMLADVSRIPGVRPGDEVILIGHCGKHTITASQLGDWCGMIPWEVLTNITHRVPRIYRGGSAA